jgi:hypothetical protein
LNYINEVKKEIYKAGKGIQSYRPEKNFSELELSLGYAAFVYWLAEGLGERKSGNSFYFEAANESGREAAIKFTSTFLTQSKVEQSIKIKRPDFNSSVEVDWAVEKASHSKWMPCLTRAIILICRSLAYNYTGIFGEKMDLPREATFSDLYKIGEQIVKDSIGRESAALIFPYKF